MRHSRGWSLQATDDTGVQSVYASVSSGSQQIGSDVPLSRSSSTDIWTGTFTFPTATQDGDYSINFRAVDTAGNHTISDPVTVRLRRHFEPQPTTTTTTEQCQIMLLSRGAATIDCTRSQDGECQIKISISGPVTIWDVPNGTGDRKKGSRIHKTNSGEDGGRDRN